MFSFEVPEMQLHQTKEPVAEIWFPGRRRKFFVIKPYGKYFMLKTKGFRGIFAMKDEYVSHIGQAPVYIYDLRNDTNIDLLVVNQLNKFAKTNKLAKVTRQHARQSNLLRGFTAKIKAKEDAIKEANIQSLNDAAKMEDAIKEGKEKLVKELEEENREKDDDEKVVATEQHESFYLLDYLYNNKKISSDEKRILENKILSKDINFEQLIEELRGFNILHIHEPMDPDAQRFLEEFGHEDPRTMAVLVDYLSDIDKKEKNMTSVPVKNWIPGSLVFALIIGSVIGVAILASMWPQIQGMFTGKHVNVEANPTNPLGGLGGMFGLGPHMILPFVHNTAMTILSLIF